MNKSYCLLTDNVILNGGDAAILEGTLEGLKPYLNNHFIHCDYYDAARLKYPYLPLKRSIQESIQLFPPSFFWRFSTEQRLQKFPFFTCSREEKMAYSAYKKASVVISCGGSFLTDNYQCSNTLIGFDLAIKNKIPIYLLGQSIGPFKSEIIKESVAKRLRKFNALIVRDNKSYKQALEMGCDSKKVFEGRDFAFLLEAQTSGVSQTSERLKIGISLRKWTYPGQKSSSNDYTSYVCKFTDLIKRLINDFDADILLISTCQGTESYSFKDDVVAKEVYDKLPSEFQDHVIINAEFHSPTQFMEKLDGLDLFIGTRMHACILALIKEIPTINICYEFKSKELFQDLGFAEFVYDIEEIDVDGISKSCQTLVDNSVQIKNIIKTKIMEYRNLNRGLIEKVFG